MNVSQSIQSSFTKSLTTLKSRKGLFSAVIFTLALIAFEAFNYSTTEFALSDLLGDLRFGGVPWATLLTLAFCGIDFAGISRLFTPQNSQEEPRKFWFMFGAWFIAATMNTILTWWGVVMAIQSHAVMSTGVVNSNFVTRTVPIFIALMVWMIRILLVGTLSKKTSQLLDGSPQVEKPSTLSRREFRQAQSKAAHASQSLGAAPLGFKGTASAKAVENKRGYKPEPTYIPMQDEAIYHGLHASAPKRR